MIEPLPNCRSICARVLSSAFCLSAFFLLSMVKRSAVAIVLVPYFTPDAGQQSLPVFISCSAIYADKKRTFQENCSQSKFLSYGLKSGYRGRVHPPKIV